MSRWRVIGSVMAVIPSVSVRCGGTAVAAAGLSDRRGGVRWGMGNAAAFGCFGCFGFIGRGARWRGDLDWRGGLGGQEQDGQQGPGRGDGAGDDAADRE